jgi:non-structural maintenance of chromosomes element 4
MKDTSTAKHLGVSIQTVSPGDLARKLMAKFATTTGGLTDQEYVPLSGFDWRAFGARAAIIYKPATAASVDCMLGAIEPPRVKVTKSAPRKKQVLEKEMRPDEMETRKQEDRNETSKLTETMFERITQHHGKAYVHFVLNHSSFAQTVENMFSIAMLVGNAKVALRADSSWGMVVQLVKGTAHNEPVQPQPKGEPAQMVLNMNYAVWEALRNAVEPQDCLTPHREAIQFVYEGEAGKGGKRKQARHTSSNEAGPSKRHAAVVTQQPSAVESRGLGILVPRDVGVLHK